MTILYYKLIKDAADYEQAKQLFTEYANSMEYYTCFDSFAQELSEIETRYGAPDGGIFLLHVDDEVVGCAGISKKEAGVAELKRMYIRPTFRGKGRGKRLLENAIQLARNLGYESLQLDTIPEMMSAAVKLYEAIGFEKRVMETVSNSQEEVAYYSMKL